VALRDADLEVRSRCEAVVQRPEEFEVIHARSPATILLGHPAGDRATPAERGCARRKRHRLTP
jgi:hypothetical protein